MTLPAMLILLPLPHTTLIQPDTGISVHRRARPGALDAKVGR